MGLALCLLGANAFAPQLQPQSSKTSLNLFEDGKKALVGFFAGAILATSIMDVTPANAFQPDDFGTTQVVAARSGGRAGGRSMGGGSMGGRSMGGGRSYAAPRSSYSSTTTIVRPMIAPPVMVSPFGFGYGYNPMGGFGLGYGLGAMNNAGNEIRDYQQENEIQRSKAELEQAKQKQAELEQRLKALEEKK